MLLGLGAALGLVGEASAGPLKEALQRELQSVRDARDLRRGLAALERETDSLEWAQTLLEHRGRESLRRLDAYRVSRDTRRKQARQRARSMYKLARGGMLRMYFEDVSNAGDADRLRTADRVTRGRTIRWLVRHDLRELGVHARAEDRARTELLAATRELAAVSGLRTMHTMERQALGVAVGNIDPELAEARRARRKARRKDELGADERALLAQITAGRAKLQRERGLDLLEPGALKRPVRGRVAGRFGKYDDPVLRLPMQRSGLELAAARRERVRAAAAGTVALVGALPGFDDVVVLDHGNGYVSLTARLQNVAVEEGQELDRGEVLGRVAPKSLDDGLGRTVYFELRHAERPIDPTPYLSGVSAPKSAKAPAAKASDG